MNHDHDELGTLLILHALGSPDTDVFLLLIYYHQSRPHLTYFRTGAGEPQPNIDIQSCYEAIRVNHAQAISWVSMF